VTVNRKTYELENSQIGKSSMNSFEINSNYSYVSGSHTLYPGVKIIRTIVYLRKPGTILVHDQIFSSKLRTYSQIFNLGKNIKVTQYTKKKLILESMIEDIQVELLQMNHVTEFKFYEGNTDPIAGWQSSAFNKKYPIPQLQFSNKGTDLEYRTIINTKEKEGVKFYSVKRKNGKNIYLITHKNGLKEEITIQKTLSRER
jgi:hypothetical protein